VRSECNVLILGCLLVRIREIVESGQWSVVSELVKYITLEVMESH
jgi:hypothetical protein